MVPENLHVQNQLQRLGILRVASFLFVSCEFPVCELLIIYIQLFLFSAINWRHQFEMVTVGTPLS